MKLVINGKTYIIGTRKKLDRNKPYQYLLRLDGKDRFYISSLFPTKQLGIYELEYQGKRYILNTLNSTIKHHVHSITIAHGNSILLP
jgi:hypothetical protein